MSQTKHHFNSGAIVEVRSFEEIQSTCDADGMYEKVPFMDEMRRFCGRRFRVFKRADKICVERPGFFDLRRMRNAVFLEEVRCDGSAHLGCARMCLIFWKEAWLKPAPAGTAPEPPIDWVEALRNRDNLFAGTPIDESKTYRCQSTELNNATEPLKNWDLRHYVRDVRSGALHPSKLPRVLFIALYNRVTGPLGWPQLGKVVGTAKKTPAVALGLHCGELVRLRRRREIEATLDERGNNRGLNFGELEVSRHCGAEYPVLRRIDRMILEHSGKMKKIDNTVLLRGTECSGLSFRGCARNCHPMFREAWLERV
jgi:hypothetical protein